MIQKSLPPSSPSGAVSPLLTGGPFLSHLQSEETQPVHPSHTSSVLDSYSPYQYDTGRVPECAAANLQYYNITFCLQDLQYKDKDIWRKRCKNLVRYHTWTVPFWGVKLYLGASYPK